MCVGCSQEHVDSEGDQLKASNIVHVAVTIEDIRHCKCKMTTKREKEYSERERERDKISFKYLDDILR